MTKNEQIKHDLLLNVKRLEGILQIAEDENCQIETPTSKFYLK